MTRVPPHIPNRAAREQVWAKVSARLISLEQRRQDAAADSKQIEIERSKLVHEAADLGMSRRQIADVLGITPARVHQLATEDPQGHLYWVTQDQFSREAQVGTMETGELFRDLEPIPGSSPPMFRKHQLGARLEEMRRGLHPGTNVDIGDGVESQRTGETLFGRSGVVTQFLSTGSRPVVEVEVDGEGLMTLFADRVRPSERAGAAWDDVEHVGSSRFPNDGSGVTVHRYRLRRGSETRDIRLIVPPGAGSAAMPTLASNRAARAAELIRRHVLEPTEIWHVGPNGAADEHGNPLLG